MDRRELFGLLGSREVGLGCGASGAEAGDHTHPAAEAGKTAGAVANFQLHVCGIHIAREDPSIQMIVQHYCGPVADMHQCLLFDSADRNAKLIGVEYTISNEVYHTLPA